MTRRQQGCCLTWPGALRPQSKITVLIALVPSAPGVRGEGVDGSTTLGTRVGRKGEMDGATQGHGAGRTAQPPISAPGSPLQGERGPRGFSKRPGTHRKGQPRPAPQTAQAVLTSFVFSTQDEA